jgi:hypothetical protein
MPFKFLCFPQTQHSPRLGNSPQTKTYTHSHKHSFIQSYIHTTHTQHMFRSWDVCADKTRSERINGERERERERTHSILQHRQGRCGEKSYHLLVLVCVYIYIYTHGKIAQQNAHIFNALILSSTHNWFPINSANPGFIPDHFPLTDPRRSPYCIRLAKVSTPSF